jgi:hypothetical protein
MLITPHTDGASVGYLHTLGGSIGSGYRLQRAGQADRHIDIVDDSLVCLVSATATERNGNDEQYVSVDKLHVIYCFVILY